MVSVKYSLPIDPLFFQDQNFYNHYFLKKFRTILSSKWLKVRYGHTLSVIDILHYKTVDLN